MKASELRIGNYLLNDKVVVSIDGRSIFDIWSYDLKDKYQPIPLTEEWLIDFGFKNDRHDECAFLDNNLYLEKNNNVSPFWGVWRGCEGNFYLRHIDYVHELQNLNFYVTGKELIKKQ